MFLNYGRNLLFRLPSDPKYKVETGLEGFQHFLNIMIFIKVMLKREMGSRINIGAPRRYENSSPNGLAN